MLSVAVSNGLAAIGLEFSRNVTACRSDWCSQGPYYSKTWQYVIINGTGKEGFDSCDYSSGLQTYPAKDPDDPAHLLQSFKEPPKAFRDAQWTQLSFPVFKYGYGWGFSSITVKLATALLILHALIIVLHVGHSLFSGVSYHYASSLAELVALALESDPAASDCGYVDSVMRGKRAIWDRKTMIRQVVAEAPGDQHAVEKIELVVADGGGIERRKTNETAEKITAKDQDDEDDNYI